MNIFASMQNLEIDAWLRGLVGAAISGGSSAVTGAIVLPSLDSNDFNIYKAKFYVAIFALFSAAAMTSVFKFLATDPLPSVKQIEKTVQTITQATSGSPKVVETVKETSIEPVKPEPTVK
jgi:hypothetical protein